jgi:hypothetical protein
MQVTVEHNAHRLQPFAEFKEGELLISDETLLAGIVTRDGGILWLHNGGYVNRRGVPLDKLYIVPKDYSFIVNI